MFVIKTGQSVTHHQLKIRSLVMLLECFEEFYLLINISRVLRVNKRFISIVYSKSGYFFQPGTGSKEEMVNL